MNTNTNTSVHAQSADADGIMIEVCVDSVESALAAIQGGADRLEICANLALGGGTTPSIGLVRVIKQSCPEFVELMAMIRPRTGDFLYSSLEIAVMLDDIKSFSQLVTGVVFGALNADGTVDVRCTQMLADAAVKCGMQVCFHRAFDMVVDQLEALSTLRGIPGITRILTSGGKPSAPAGLRSLMSLFEQNPKPDTSSSTDTNINNSSPQPSVETEVEIMPGSGINASTVSPLLRPLLPLGCRAVHLSGGEFVDSEMRYRSEDKGMGEWRIWRTSEATVRAVREAVDREWVAYNEALDVLRS